MTNKNSAKNALQWIISIGIPLLILLIPVNETFTAQMRLYLMITLIGILFFAFGNVKQTVVSFALPWAYVLTGVTTADVVFSPWATTTIWMFVGSFFLINALTSLRPAQSDCLQNNCYLWRHLSWYLTGLNHY